jgi:hypothetical protein
MPTMRSTGKTPSSATPLRTTPAPKGLRIIAKGCRASARLPWYQSSEPGSKPSTPPHPVPTSSARHELRHTPPVIWQFSLFSSQFTTSVLRSLGEEGSSYQPPRA